jgi:hypothetical protein
LESSEGILWLESSTTSTVCSRSATNIPPSTTTKLAGLRSLSSIPLRSDSELQSVHVPDEPPTLANDSDATNKPEHALFALLHHRREFEIFLVVFPALT